MGNQWRGIDKTDINITREGEGSSFSRHFFYTKEQCREIFPQFKSIAVTLTKSNVSEIFAENLGKKRDLERLFFLFHVS
jgi:hypothetical protein